MTFWRHPSLQNTNFEHSYHRIPISCKGIIRDINRTVPDEVILKNVKTPNNRPILRIEKINRRTINNLGESTYVPTNSIVVTFRGNKLPEAVTILFNHRPVEVFMPRVVQCFGCLRCGHTKKICKTKEIRCPACSLPHTLDECSNKLYPTCAFCEGNHVSNEQETRLKNRICPEYLKPVKIKEIMMRYNMSFFEAVDKVEPPEAKIRNIPKPPKIEIGICQDHHNHPTE